MPEQGAQAKRRAEERDAPQRGTAPRGEAAREAQEAYVLHAYPYRETSLLVELFARRAGRLSVVARAARRPRSAVRGVLMAFQPLLVSWYGRGEVRTLAGAEWQGAQPLLQGEALLSGFYLNELLLRLLAREDPHEALFEKYRATLAALAHGAEAPPALRSFELALLRELGYGPTLDRDAASGGPIDPRGDYTYEPERGPLASNGSAAELRLAGSTLLDLAREDFSNPRTLMQAKALMRMLINHRLDFKPLASRRVFKELLEL